LQPRGIEFVLEKLHVPPKMQRLLFACCVLLLVLFLALLLRALRLGQYLQGMKQPSGTVEAGTLPQSFPRWEERTPGELSFWVSPKASFPNGYAQGGLQFENAAASLYTLEFELTVEQKGKRISVYRSPPIPPGHTLNGAKLTLPLKKGDYQAACIAYAYEPNGATPAARSEEQHILITVLH
jgi:hypothetical protein